MTANTSYIPTTESLQQRDTYLDSGVLLWNETCHQYQISNNIGTNYRYFQNAISH